MSHFFMSDMANKSPERGSMLQKYMFLHSQKTNWHRRSSSPSSSSTVSNSSPTTSPEMSATSSANSSLTSSPTLTPISAPAISIPKTRKRSSPSPIIPSIPEEAISPSEDLTAAPSSEDDQLFNISHEIKSTLTELLNCDAVRKDGKMRLWVQSRLMDAELELKKQRRRRISVPTINISAADNADDLARRTPSW